MPRLKSRIALALIALVSLGALPTRFSYAQGSAIDTYAISNARIVPVSGPARERGTVVIRDGLIAAVGSNVSIPADARVIDGNGLTVYPGLFDSNTSLGMPQPSSSPAATPGGGGGRWTAGNHADGIKLFATVPFFDTTPGLERPG